MPALNRGITSKLNNYPETASPRDSVKSESPSGQKYLDNKNKYLKRTILFHNVSSNIDPGRVLYPKGLLSRVARRFVEKDTMVNRVELLARKQKETYGVIRSFHVAYSTENQLLGMAEASNNVISVRTLESSLSEDGKAYGIIEDRLVLRRGETDTSEERQVQVFTRQATPELMVSKIWLEKMKLGPESRVLVSNPIENYTILPPNVSNKTVS